MPFQNNDSSVEPFALSIRAYMKRSGISRARVYELLRNDELASYLEGSHRKITLRSIVEREQRLLAEAKVDNRLGRDITKPRSRSAVTSRKPPAADHSPPSAA